MQINFLTKLAYQGKNEVSLEQSQLKNGFKSNQWLTFLQAKQLGLKVKKGEHSTASVFKGFQNFKEKQKDGKTKEYTAPLGFARVFNLDQTEKNMDTNLPLDKQNIDEIKEEEKEQFDELMETD